MQVVVTSYIIIMLCNESVRNVGEFERLLLLGGLSIGSIVSMYLTYMHAQLLRRLVMGYDVKTTQKNHLWVI